MDETTGRRSNKRRPATLTLDRALADLTLRVPRDIRLEDDLLIWRWDHMTRRTATSELLARFLRLAGASDDDILEFATQWGVLGICEHNMPASHLDLECSQ